ncbi:MAG: SpoIID/LytB domain-containing protein [Candidatus Firestonebacteria bacterium]
MKIIKYFLISLALIGCYTGKEYIRGIDYKDENIRLLIMSDIKSCKINPINTFKIVDIHNNLISLGISNDILIESSDNKLKVNGKIITGNALKIISNDNKIKINEYVYRGIIEVSKEKDTLDIINELPIEEYLYGIVGREMGSAHIEALKAQAVAARTFTYDQKQHSKSKKYDINNTGQSISYTGILKENPDAIESVNSTKGEIIKYNGKLIFAPFYANCGGYTEDVKEVWGITYPYLVPTPCYFCKNKKHYSWVVEIEKQHFVDSLRKKGYDISKVLGMNIIETSKTGRMKKMEIMSEKGKIIIDTNQLRLLVGSNTLKSTRFTVREKASTFLFRGKGWGHGVGLCQDGAEGMAKAGYKYKQILNKYYKEVQVSTR